MLGEKKVSEKKLDDSKIAFIICTNDEVELQECIFYLNNLNVPSDFEIEMITVEHASSMASGYNEAMVSSDAKYKIYLHQDVFVLNQNFLIDILSVFRTDSNIGLLGCVGSRKLPDNANAITAWDTGRLLHNCVPNEKIEFQDESQNPTMVEAVDGCLIATQYDIPWREDLFDGWDFYDISQCYEFHRRGIKVAIPYQATNWIYHDNRHAKMTDYDYYRKRFVEEYKEYSFQYGKEKVLTREYYSLRENVVSLVKELFYQGEMESVCAVFANPVNRGSLALKEYELLAQIYLKEERKDKTSLYFEMNMPNVMKRFSLLRFLVKRIEFNVGCQVENICILLQSYSERAIRETILAYCIDKSATWEKIKR